MHLVVGWRGGDGVRNGGGRSGDGLLDGRGRGRRRDGSAAVTGGWMGTSRGGRRPRGRTSVRGSGVDGGRLDGGPIRSWWW